MNRTHIELTDDQHEQLNEVARRKGRPLHELIGEAIDLFLDEVAPDPDTPRGDRPKDRPAPGSEHADR